MFDFLNSLFGFFGSGDAGSSFGGGLLNSFLSMFNAGLDSFGLSQHGRDQYFAREMSREFLEKQMAFQREMTANQQDFTREMYGQQWQDMLSKYPELQKRMSDIQFNNWRQQFNLQNQYNSYQNQVGRMLAAGINPNSIYGNGSVATSSMSGQGVSAPPTISPTPFQSHASPIGIPQGLSSNGRDIASIGQFLKDYSEMQLNQKKIGRFDEQLDAQIKESLAKAGLDEAKSKYQDLLTQVDSFYLPKEKESQVKLNLALAAKYAAEENESESQSKLNEALEALNKTKNEEAKARLPFVEMEMRAEIDDILSSAQEKRAQAAKANQEAETEKYNTRITQIRSEVDASTKVSKIVTLINELHAKRQIDSTKYKDAKIKLDRLRVLEKQRNNDAVFRGVDGMLDWLSDKIGLGASAVVK